jgi:hypothetical protein
MEGRPAPFVAAGEGRGEMIGVISLDPLAGKTGGDARAGGRVFVGGDMPCNAVEAVPGEADGRVGNGDSSCSGIGGPEVGVRPSRSALAPSAAFHRAYCSFCSIYGGYQLRGGPCAHLFGHAVLKAPEDLNELPGHDELAYCRSDTQRGSHNSQPTLQSHLLSGDTRPVVIIRRHEHFEGKVLDVHGAGGFARDGVVACEHGFHLVAGQ